MKQNQQNKTKKKSNAIWVVPAAVVLFGGIAWFSLRTTETPTQESRVQTPVKLTTLPPSMFTGKTREAYQVAKDIPEVLEQVQCYCGCRRSAGHQNNLFCFTDDHGVG